MVGNKLTSQFNNEAVLAQTGSSVIEKPALAVASNTLRDDHPDSGKSKGKKLRDFIDLVDATRAYLEQLQRDIDELERGFVLRDGEAWREKLALKILDADDIPQRRSDENMEAYRERLEPILVEQMLNADGSIKKQYLNAPELLDYAQWAQKKYHYNIALGYVRELEDPNTPPARKEEIEHELTQNTDIETLVFAERGAKAGSEVQGAVKDITDDSHDSKLQVDNNAALNDFLTLNK